MRFHGPTKCFYNLYKSKGPRTSQGQALWGRTTWALMKTSPAANQLGEQRAQGRSTRARTRKHDATVMASKWVKEGVVQRKMGRAQLYSGKTSRSFETAGEEAFGEQDAETEDMLLGKERAACAGR